MLPCAVRVIAGTHPLHGRVLDAVSFIHRRGGLHLVVRLPGSSPGTIPASATDIFGERAATVLDADGRLQAAGAGRGAGGREAAGQVSPARKAAKVPAAAICGISELDRAVVHVERAVAELKAARQVWGSWADGIRQRAERRLGLTDLSDQRVLEDLEYARAPNVGGPYIDAVNAAEAALAAGRSSGGELR